MAAVTTASLPMRAHGQPRDGASVRQVTNQPTVPDDMTEWKLSIANVGLREIYRRCRTGPAIDLKSNGVLAIRNRKESEQAASGQLAADDLKKLFGASRSVINSAYLADTGRADRFLDNDIVIYEIRMAHGSRALQLKFDDPQPARMAVDDDLGETMAVLNNAITRMGLECKFRMPRKLDASYRDKCLSEPHERVPEKLGEWSWVDIEMNSKRQRLHLQMRGNSRQGSGLLIESGPDKSLRERVSQEERDVFYQCARHILNQFEFSKDDDQPVTGGVRISIGIEANDRSITAEFDDYSRLPAEWRQSIARALEVAKVSAPVQNPQATREEK